MKLASANALTAAVCVCVAAMVAVAGSARAADVYVLSSGDAEIDSAMESTLEGFGHAVDIGVEYLAFDGTQDLTGYDVALLQMNDNWSYNEMPPAGQTAMVDFISAGGGLVTAEWSVWATYRAFDILEVALPADTLASYNFATSITYTAVDADATLNAGVADPFTFTADAFGGTEVDMWAKPRAQTFYDSSNLTDAVVGWGYGAGNAICFSTCMGPLELDDPDYARLVSNAVIWSTLPGIPGDCNRDRRVDIADLGQVATHRGQCGVGWLQGDFDGDTCVDDADIAALAANYGYGTTTTVPEPAALCMLILGAAAIFPALRRRRSGAR